LEIPHIDVAIQRTSNTIICSIASGEQHKALADIMKPTVELYGRVHGIDTLLLTDRLVPEKPSAWDKIVLLYNLLKQYEIVIWLDADTIIVDPTVDIRKELHSNYAMFLVTHFKRRPIFPNSGVWVVRRSYKSLKLLQAIWDQSNQDFGVWWEQQALLNLLGFRNSGHDIHSYKGPTQFTYCIGPLDLKWNSRPGPYDRGDVAEHPVILHFCGMPMHERIQSMQESYQKFLKISRENGLLD
jgi:hypothetical protein